LDLSENQLTKITLNRFADLLALPECRLECLSLRDNNLKSKSTSAWEEENENEDDNTDCALSKLLRALKGNKSLTLLDLSHNYLNFCSTSPEVFEEFSQNESLVYLMLGNNRLIANEYSSQAFGQFFAHLPQNIAHLNLSYVGLDSFQIQSVYEATLQKPNLTHLCLSDNMLGRDSCTILALMLRNNTSLRSLNLSDNHIWDSGARILSESIGSNTSLLTLELSRNRVGRASLDLVSSCVRSTEPIKLKLLDLRVNGVSHEVTQQIEELIKDKEMNVLLSSFD